MKLCPSCSAQNGDDAAFCVQCQQFFAPAAPVAVAPAPTQMYAPAPTQMYAPAPTQMYAPAPLPQMMPAPIAAAGQKGDGTLGGLIPVHNPKALLSYYLGLFSLFPVLGFFLGVAAVVLGIQGLKLHKQHPEARGKAHAIVGVVCGTLFGGFNLLLLIVIALAFLSHPPTP